MFTMEQVKKRCRIVYDNQVARHRKKLEKAAKVKIQISSSDVLPYSFSEFFQWAWRRYGTGVHLCPYCTKPIDVFSMQFDHTVPLEKGGSLRLDNIEGICKECNELKSAQTPEEFQKLLNFLGTLDPAHRRFLEQRIRAGAVANRLRFFPRQRKDAESGQKSLPAPQPRQARIDYDLGKF